MIVTTGTTNGESQKCTTGNAYNICEFIRTLLLREQRILPFYDIFWSRDQKTRGSIRTAGVSCDLLKNEAVIRFILIETSDHIIPVMVCSLSFVIGFKAVAVRISDHI